MPFAFVPAPQLLPDRPRGRAFAGLRPGARSGGFTLIEMLTAISVLVITLALAAPSIGSLIRSSRVRAAQSELVSSLMLARSEAARRGVPITVKAKGAGLAHGWQVWFDADGNGVRSDAEPLLRDVADLGTSVVISTVPAGASAVVFSPRGFLVPLAGIGMNVCDSQGGRAYRVRLQPAGLADIEELSSCPA